MRFNLIPLEGLSSMIWGTQALKIRLKLRFTDVRMSSMTMDTVAERDRMGAGI